MIELKNIVTYDGNFTRKNETGRNKENMGADFSEFINNKIQSPVDTDTNSVNVNENEYEIHLTIEPKQTSKEKEHNGL